jgi:arylformamidase
MTSMSSESDLHGAAEPERERWVDISVPLRNAMVHWPSDPPVRIERVLDVERGDSHTLSEIVMGSHSGTHMDAPLHFMEHGIGIDRMPLDITLGRARVIEIQDTESIKRDELVQHRIRRGERILFKTRNSSWAWQTDEFVEDFVFISREAATFLAEVGVRLVGVDYLSVGAFAGEGSQTHRSLLEEGVWIIEGLDLSRVAPGRYYLVCLPLRIQAGDGAPARAILRPLRASETGQR